MVEGGAVDTDVQKVEMDKDIVTVRSQKPQPEATHLTTYDFKDPHDCRLFLREIDKNPSLMERVGLAKIGEKIVIKAIGNLSDSFNDSPAELVRRDMLTITKVSDTYGDRKAVQVAFEAAANKTSRTTKQWREALAAADKSTDRAKKTPERTWAQNMADRMNLKRAQEQLAEPQ